jgi:hypothetical protein
MLNNYKIFSSYEGDGYWIYVCNEKIHYSETVYDRDMFIAELIARLSECKKIEKQSNI